MKIIKFVVASIILTILISGCQNDPALKETDSRIVAICRGFNFSEIVYPYYFGIGNDSYASLVSTIYSGVFQASDRSAAVQELEGDLEKYSTFRMGGRGNHCFLESRTRFDVNMAEVLALQGGGELHSFVYNAGFASINLFAAIILKAFGAVNLDQFVKTLVAADKGLYTFPYEFVSPGHVQYINKNSFPNIYIYRHIFVMHDNIVTPLIKLKYG